MKNLIEMELKLNNKLKEKQVEITDVKSREGYFIVDMANEKMLYRLTLHEKDYLDMEIMDISSDSQIGYFHIDLNAKKFEASEKIVHELLDLAFVL